MAPQFLALLIVTGCTKSVPSLAPPKAIPFTLTLVNEGGVGKETMVSLTFVNNSSEPVLFDKGGVSAFEFEYRDAKGSFKPLKFDRSKAVEIGESTLLQEFEIVEPGGSSNAKIRPFLKCRVCGIYGCALGQNEKGERIGVLMFSGTELAFIDLQPLPKTFEVRVVFDPESWMKNVVVKERSHPDSPKQKVRVKLPREIITSNVCKIDQ